MNIDNVSSKCVSEPNQQKGFTLIEIMLVIAIIGLIMSGIQVTFSQHEPEKLLENTSKRFAGVFELVTEYGMLNNLELALHVTKNSYQFLAFNGEKWQAIDHELFQEYSVPEGVELALQLDDLPIEEPQLLDESLLKEQQENKSLFDKENDDEEFDGTEEKEKKKLIPQVYILSGGDITPFSLSFSFQDFVFDIENPFYYKVSGLYSMPLLIEGPIQGIAEKGVLSP